MKQILGDSFYEESEMAKALGFKSVTLRNRRSKGIDHPPYKKFGREILYPVKEAEAWVKSRPLIREVNAETRLEAVGGSRRKTG